MLTLVAVMGVLGVDARRRVGGAIEARGSDRVAPVATTLPRLLLACLYDAADDDEQRDAQGDQAKNDSCSRAFLRTT